jgi:hypothetical protein
MMKLKMTVACMEEMRIFYKILIRRNHAGRPRHRNRMRGPKDVDWINLAQYRDQ